MCVDPNNPVYYSEGNCLIERATGKVIFGTANSELPQGERVHSIGIGAFAWCNFKDAKFEIPGSIKVVEDCAFFGSWGQGLCFMTGVCSIGNFALSATSINSIYFHETIVQIGFCDLPDTIRVLTVDKKNLLFYLENNCLIRTRDKTVLAVVGSKVEIPDGVEKIAPFACTACSQPTRLVAIPDSVMQIENDAMANSLLSLMYGLNFSKPKAQKINERGNFYCKGHGAAPIAVIMAHKNSYAIKYAQQHLVAYLYSEELSNR